MPTGDQATASAKALGADETDTYSLGQPGGEKLSGIIERATTGVTVTAVWLDDDGNDVISEQLASPSAGTQGTWDTPCRTQKCRLEVADSGSGAGDYDLAALFR